MRERINQLAAGIVTVNVPELTFQPEMLEGKVQAGGLHSKEIIIKSRNKVFFKGFFYSTNGRVKVCTRQAAGQSAAIVIEINTVGCEINDVIRGSVLMVSNAGEKSIDYNFTVCAQGKTEVLPETIEEFAKLYEEKPASAIRLFMSEQFLKLSFMEGNVRRIARYEGLTDTDQEHQALEEFLVGEQAKSPVYLCVPEKKKIINADRDELEESLLLEVTSGGYIRGSISADCEWLECDRNYFTHRDFEAGRMLAAVKIDPGKMHAGKNIGCIRISTAKEEKKVVFEALKNVRTHPKNGLMPDKSVTRYISSLMLAYLNDSYEEEMIFAQLSQTIQENIKKYPACVQLHLLHAWYLIKVSKLQEAASILDWCEPAIAKSREGMSSEYCTTLYLRARISGRENDMEKAGRMINHYYDENPGLWISILRVLVIGMSEDEDTILGMIREEIQRYPASSVLYGIAARIYRGNPEKICMPGKLEVHTLAYMLSNHCGNDAAEDAFLRLPLAGYSSWKLIYILMTRLYSRSRDPRALKIICEVLIRERKSAPRYAAWFEEGVRQGIHLSGLNDAYMASVARELPGREIPLEILLYYSYKNDLDNDIRSNLYTYILEHFAKDSDMYQAYEEQMDEFAIRQLLDGKIDAQLVKLYDNILIPGMIDSHLSKMLPDLLFSRRISTSLSFAQKAVIHYSQLRAEKTVRLIAGEASIPVYTDDAVILFEDAKGDRYSDPFMTSVKLMNRTDLVQICKENSPDQLMLLLEEVNELYQKPIRSERTFQLVKKLMDMPEIHSSFRRVLSGRLIDYCYEHEEKETKELNEWLCELNLQQLSDERRRKVMEMLVDRGFIREAFDAVKLYDTDRLKADTLLRFAVRCITETLYENDEYLVRICRQLIARQQINETVLTYLSLHFNGLTADMFNLLLLTEETKADSRDLSERVVAQMMFAGIREHLDEAFEIYSRKKPVSDTIRRAYYVIRCHGYFTGGNELPERVFEAVEAMLGKTDPSSLPDIYSYALLLYYSRLEDLTSAQKHLCEVLLYGYCAAGIYLGCYHQLGRHVELPHQMEGRIILQSITKPSARVYAKGELKPQGKNICYEMKEIYPGVYTAAVFLFPDETCAVSIICEEKGKEPVRADEVRITPDKCYCREGSCYEDIRELIALRRRDDYRHWQLKAEKTIRRRGAAEQLFPLL